MTSYQLKRRAIRNFRNFDAPKNVKRQYQRQWLRWVQHLGSRWLAASSVQKGTYDV